MRDGRVTSSDKRGVGEAKAKKEKPHETISGMRLKMKIKCEKN